MAIEGFIDISNDREVRGWVYDDVAPDEPLNLEIVVGAQVVGIARANQFRPDLLTAGKGNGKHGFAFFHDRPEPGSTLRVRLAGRRWYLQSHAPVKESPRYVGQLAHSLEFGLPQVEYEFSSAPMQASALEISVRLLQAYHAATARGGDTAGEPAVDPIHREIIDLLKQKDAAGLTDYLRDAHARGLTQGITQGHINTALLCKSAEVREHTAALVQDKLVSLAEYLGVLDTECPAQQGPWADNLHTDSAALTARIATAIGIQVVPPQVIGSLFGLRTPRGILSGSDIISLYAALRLKELAGNLALTAPRICEIGGRMGSTAYYTAKLGLGSFTLFDTPLVNVLQGYYLLNALPQTKIALFGEPVDAGVTLRILPLGCFGGPADPYDLLLNHDWFAETSTEAGLAILRAARQCIQGALVSINHEARGPRTPLLRQAVVRDLVRQVGGFTRQSRFRHWLEMGYVEEVFAIDRPAPALRA